MAQLPDIPVDDYNAHQAQQFAAATGPLLDQLAPGPGGAPAGASGATPLPTPGPTPDPGAAPGTPTSPSTPDSSASTPTPTPPATDLSLSPNQQTVAAGGVPSLRSRNLISNQFDYQADQELTPQEAWSACGPTAALAFARYAGRQPTIGEALSLAKEVGWDPSLGMAGPGSEVSLLGKLGVTSQYNPGASPQSVASEVGNGRPVILDTPNHYYAIDDYNPATGLYHVGGSGLALKGGSEWMSWDQISQHGQGVRGSITLAGQSAGPDQAAPGGVAAGGQPSPLTMGAMRSAPGPGPTSAAAPASFADVSSALIAQIDPGSSAAGGSVASAPERAGANPITTDSQPGKARSDPPPPTPSPIIGAPPAAQDSAAPSFADASSALIAQIDPSGAASPDQAPGNITTSTPTPATPPFLPGLGNVDPSNLPALPSLGGIAGAIGDVLQAPAQLVQGSLPALGGNQDSPGQRLAAAYAQTDPSLPVPQRMAAALKVFSAPFSQSMATGAQLDPSGGWLSAPAEAATNLATDPGVMLGLPAFTPAMGIGAAALGAAGTVAGKASGASPEQTAQLATTGAGLGMMAGPAAEALGSAVSRLAPYVPPALRAAGAAVRDVGATADALGITPGLSLRATVNGAPPLGPPSLAQVATDAGGSLGKALNEIVAPARNTPPAVQAVIRNLANARLQAQVDGESLARQAKAVLGPLDTAATASLYEHTGQFAANPTPAQAQLATAVHDYLTQTGDLGRANGYIRGDPVAGGAVANYFPHLYEDAAGAAPSAANISPVGKNLNPNDFYSQTRQFPDIASAVAGGQAPVDSVSQALGHYALHVQNSEAEYQAGQALSAAGTQWAKPYQPGDPLPPGWVRGENISPVFAPKPRAVLNNAGNVAQVFSNGTAFEPQVAQAISNVLSPSAWRGTAIGNTYLNLSGAGKQLLFSMSGFHNVTELRQAVSANGVRGIPVVGRALVNGFLPGAWDTWRLEQAPLLSAAARAGVTGLAGEGQALDQGGKVAGAAGMVLRSGAGAVAGASSGYGIATAAGVDDKTKLKYALGGALGGALAGPLAGPIADALWERQVPTLKAMTWQIQVAAGRDPEAAAAFVNNTYGGQNLAAIARSQTVQDTARFVFLAPDWWESWANQLGSAFKGGDLGGQARAYWARTAITSAFTLEGLNYALNHHFTNQNDPDHANQLEVTGLYKMLGVDRRDPTTGAPIREYMSVLPSPIEALLNLSGGQLTKFAVGRLGIAPRIAAEQIANKDYRGQAIVPPYTPTLEAGKLRAANVLSQISPVGIQQAETGSAGGEPASLAAFAAATGLRTAPASKATPAGPQLSPAAYAIVHQSGAVWQPSPVGPAIGRVGLTRDERTRLQTLTDRYRDAAIAQLPGDASWRSATPDEQVAALRYIEAQALDRAKGDVAATIPDAEMQRRATISAGAKRVKAGGSAAPP